MKLDIYKSLLLWWLITVSKSQMLTMVENIYRKVSNIRRTQNQNLNDSRFNMQLPLSNPLKPGVESRMKM